MLYAKLCDRPGSVGEGQSILKCVHLEKSILKDTKCVLKVDTCSSILYVGSRGSEEVWMRSRGSANSRAEDMRKLYTGIPETSSQILGWVLQIIVRETAMSVITIYMSLSAVGLQCCHLLYLFFFVFTSSCLLEKKKWPYLWYCLLFTYPLCLSNRKKRVSTSCK